MKRLRKRTVIILRSLILLILFGWVIWALSSRREIADADLKPGSQQVPSDQNAFGLLTQAGAALSWPKEKEKSVDQILKGEVADPEFIRQMIEQNQTSLNMLTQSIALRRLQIPPPRFFAEEFPYLTQWKSLARLQALRAMYWEQQGNPVAAREAAFKIVELGGMVECGRGSLIHYSAGVSIKEIGLKCLVRISESSPFPEPEIVPATQKLLSFNSNSECLTNAVKMEYQLGRHFCDEYKSGKMDGTNIVPTGIVMIPPFFSAYKTKNKFALMLRACLADIPRPASAMSSKVLNDKKNSRIALLLNGNVMGEMMADMWTYSYPKFIQRKCRENTAVGATAAILAIHTFEKGNGRIPENLQELVPQYLPQIPFDDYDGKPLRYSRDKMLVYSVGEDLIDSGGTRSPKRGGPDDILFEIKPKTEFKAIGIPPPD